MAQSSNPLEVKMLPAEKIFPNPWNPNRMDGADYKKLRREISDNGLSAPLLVRPLHGGHQVIDGEHRLKIARELGITDVPAVVRPMDDTGARIMTLSMNGLRGKNDPTLLAALLAELAAAVPPPDLARALPWSADEISGMAQMAGKKAESALKSMGRVFSPPEKELFAVVLRRADKKTVDRAVAHARAAGNVDEASALVRICRQYLDGGEQ